MKRTFFTTLLILFFVSTVYLPLSDAQDTTTWEFAKAQLEFPHIILGPAYAPPDGDTFAVLNREYVRIYDAQSYQEIHRLQVDVSRLGGFSSMTFSPDGQTLATGHIRGQVNLWDTETGELRHELFAPLHYVTYLDFSPDGQTLAAAGGYHYCVCLWDAEAGELKHRLDYSLSGVSGQIQSIAFSPDGQTLATGNYYGYVHLSDVETGELKHKLQGYVRSVKSIAFSPLDGRTLAAGGTDGYVHLWDVETGELQRRLDGDTQDVFSVAFSPDGQTLASAGMGENVSLWDVETGELQRRLDGDVYDGANYSVWRVAFSPDGQTLATGSNYGHKSGIVLLWEITPTSQHPGETAADVNGDGIVNIQDLISVAGKFSADPAPDDPADVNNDGTIDKRDLIAVDTAMGEAAGAPTVDKYTDTLTRETVQRWLTEAQSIASVDPVYLRGIAVLQQLLVALTPKETALLANYPNPFNPETWIPYQLASPVDVSITIYAANGTLVRTLNLGHQPVGMYQHRNRAAHWDGRNALGELVASGVYFYTLTAGDFTATRKMLIRK